MGRRKRGGGLPIRHGRPTLNPLVVVLLSASLTLTLLVYYLVSLTADEVARRRRADIFRAFDVSEEFVYDVECRRDLQDDLCPDDDGVPCGGIVAVQDFCAAILGEVIVAESANTPIYEGRNALEGCKNYVSWDEGRGNCCLSNICMEIDPGPVVDDDDAVEGRGGDGNDDDDDDGVYFDDDVRIANHNDDEYEWVYVDEDGNEIHPDDVPPEDRREF